MKLVKPASDPYHRKRIMQRIDDTTEHLLPHYALSHLWGVKKPDPKDWWDYSAFFLRAFMIRYLVPRFWDDDISSYFQDAITSHVLKPIYDILFSFALKLSRIHLYLGYIMFLVAYHFVSKCYLWMDIILFLTCKLSSTLLYYTFKLWSIFLDYAFKLWCIAFAFALKLQDVTKTSPNLWKDIGQYVDDENGQPAAPVSMRLEKRKTLLTLLSRHPDSYWWIDVLCARTDTPLDIMGDIYAWCSVCYALVDCDTSVIRQLYFKRNRLVSSAYDAPWSLDEYHEAATMLDTFTESKWWKRVWTWQEAVLPNKVVFMAETNITVTNSDMLSIDNLFAFYHWVLDEYVSMESPIEDIYCARRHRYSAAYSNLMPALNISRLLRAFATSKRQCMDPVDYVYGVLGLFQFNIPRMTDPNQVWQCFLTELENYLAARVEICDSIEKSLLPVFTDDDQAHRYDLTTANDLGDVFRSLTYSYCKSYSI
ncbi:hypothetical protein K492DRAFT_200503 [Lichtheimia hyalospora FSU 10163]|nr:hypothetical protein K492DRAFT_200503 [Lichtheimia hyalospora FSU 10163]